MVVLHCSPANAGLIEALTRTLAEVGVGRITCVRDGAELPPAIPERVRGIEVRTLALATSLSSDAYVDKLIHEVEIVDAHSVIVLPRAGMDEPDSNSRLTCAAIRRACGARVGPNVLVEIEDPEAAFEFVGLGVATVFYPGHLRAALLGQACIDLGVFQFIVGLLRGRYHVRSVPVPDELRDATFADAALAIECDGQGRAMTIIGVAKGRNEGGQPLDVIVNPGPRSSLTEVACLMALVSGDDAAQARAQ